MTSHSTARRNGTRPQSPAELKAEIAQTRDDLGETAAALAAKADVKARAQEKVTAVRERVATTAAQVSDSGPVQAVTRRPLPVAVIAAVASAAVVALVLIRRNRR